MKINTMHNSVINISLVDDTSCVDNIDTNRCAKSVIKRCLDFIVAFIFITTAFIPIFIFVALCITIESRGGIFFIQERTGQFGKTFRCYKFRTMKINREANILQATQNDTRTTSVGRFLRKTSLDELPQVINVLLGDMSFVGPRPHMLKHTEEFTKAVKNYDQRHCVRPGITGYAQINGFRGEITSRNDIVGRVNHDIWYINNWSLWMDVSIVISTIKLLVGCKDTKAY